MEFLLLIESWCEVHFPTSDTELLLLSTFNHYQGFLMTTSLQSSCNNSAINFSPLPKLQRGDKVAILSPSFVAPAYFPHVYELGLTRLRDVFGLEPIAFPSTANKDATHKEKAADLIEAFERPDIKAVIATIGGDDQIEWVKTLPQRPFQENPKPFFGYSDNTHLANHLWQCGVPSFYGGALFIQFARQCEMDSFTVDYLKKALFERGIFELRASETFNDEDLAWEDPAILAQKRRYQPNDGWHWDLGEIATPGDFSGITWGGCLESIDELLRHRMPLPTPEQFTNIVLYFETSEELPEAPYVSRILRALGELGILQRVQGVLVGRPKAWSFEKPNTDEIKKAYTVAQMKAVRETVRRYNREIPIIQNMDFGHTDPQICLPMGSHAVINCSDQKISVSF